MQASEPAPISGKRWPDNKRWERMSTLRRSTTGRPAVIVCGVAWLLIASTVSTTACEAPEDHHVDDAIASQHAELTAEEIAKSTTVIARDLVLRHPNSERQRQSRRQLLFLDEHIDQFGPIEERHDESGESPDDGAAEESP